MGSSNPVSLFDGVVLVGMLVVCWWHWAKLHAELPEDARAAVGMFVMVLLACCVILLAYGSAVIVRMLAPTGCAG